MNTVFIGEFELNILWAILKLKKKALLVPITKQLSKTTGKKEPIEAVYTTLRQMEKVGFIRFGIWKAKKKGLPI